MQHSMQNFVVKVAFRTYLNIKIICICTEYMFGVDFSSYKMDQTEGFQDQLVTDSIIYLTPLYNIEYVEALKFTFRWY